MGCQFMFITFGEPRRVPHDMTISKDEITKNIAVVRSQSITLQSPTFHTLIGSDKVVMATSTLIAIPWTRSMGLDGHDWCYQLGHL